MPGTRKKATSQNGSNIDETFSLKKNCRLKVACALKLEE